MPRRNARKKHKVSGCADRRQLRGACGWVSGVLGHARGEVGHTSGILMAAKWWWW